MFEQVINSISAMLLGLTNVLKHLFRKPVTIQYPEEIQELNRNFRGKHSLINCRGCGYCQKVCPADAIEIKKSEKGLETYIIDLGKCIFCGNCMYYCPTKSMKMTKSFNLVTNNKFQLKISLKNETNESEQK